MDISKFEEVLELEKDFQDWKERYGIKQFIPQTRENAEIVKGMDGSLIWSRIYNQDEYAVPYFLSGIGGDVMGWYVASVPSEESATDVWFNVSVDCPECQGSDRDETEESDCQTCEGNGDLYYSIHPDR